MNPREIFIHIHQGCFAGTGAIVRLPQCQWSKPDGYGKISQCITTTKHSKAKTVCIFLGIYCIYHCRSAMMSLVNKWMNASPLLNMDNRYVCMQLGSRSAKQMYWIWWMELNNNETILWSNNHSAVMLGSCRPSKINSRDRVFKIQPHFNYKYILRNCALWMWNVT